MGFLAALADPAMSIPLLGKVDASSRSGRLKIGIGFSIAFGILLVVVFTVGGLLVK